MNKSAWRDAAAAPAHSVTFFIWNVFSRLRRLLFKAPPCDCCFALIASQPGGGERSQLLHSAAIMSMPLSQERAALCNLFRATPYLRGKVGAAVCLANVVWKFGPSCIIHGCRSCSTSHIQICNRSKGVCLIGSSCSYCVDSLVEYRFCWIPLLEAEITSWYRPNYDVITCFRRTLTLTCVVWRVTKCHSGQVVGSIPGLWPLW